MSIRVNAGGTDGEKAAAWVGRIGQRLPGHLIPQWLSAVLALASVCVNSENGEALSRALHDARDMPIDILHAITAHAMLLGATKDLLISPRYAAARVILILLPSQSKYARLSLRLSEIILGVISPIHSPPVKRTLSYSTPCVPSARSRMACCWACA